MWILTKKKNNIQVEEFFYYHLILNLLKIVLL